MNEQQREALAQKKAHLKAKLDAERAIHHYVTSRWLWYFKDIVRLGIPYELEYLFVTSEDNLPYYHEAVEKLRDPLLDPQMIKTGFTPFMHYIFDDFPSLSHFKYVIDLPVFAEYGGDPTAKLQEAANILNLKDQPVYLVSNDYSPLLKLNLSDVINNATELFDDGGIATLIIADPEKRWLIFRNIEEEWRCGFWRG